MASATLSQTLRAYGYDFFWLTFRWSVWRDFIILIFILIDSLIPFWVALCLLHLSSGHWAIQRGIRVSALLRVIRVITYFRRYARWVAMGMVPFSKEFFSEIWNHLIAHGPPFGGGCKDLIFSGHLVMLLVIGLSLHHIWGRRSWLGFFVVGLYWCMLFQKSMRAIIEGHHYSVDMIIGLYITLFAWFTPFINWVPADLSSYPKWSRLARLHAKKNE